LLSSLSLSLTAAAAHQQAEEKAVGVAESFGLSVRRRVEIAVILTTGMRENVRRRMKAAKGKHERARGEHTTHLTTRSVPPSHVIFLPLSQLITAGRLVYLPGDSSSLTAVHWEGYSQFFLSLPLPPYVCR